MIVVGMFKRGSRSTIAKLQQLDPFQTRIHRGWPWESLSLRHNGPGMSTGLVALANLAKELGEMRPRSFGGAELRVTIPYEETVRFTELHQSAGIPWDCGRAQQARLMILEWLRGRLHNEILTIRSELRDEHFAYDSTLPGLALRWEIDDQRAFVRICCDSIRLLAEILEQLTEALWSKQTTELYLRT